MKSFRLALFILLAMLLFSPTIYSAPVIPGLSNKHPLTERQVGQLLIEELRCVACHRSKEKNESFERTAPDLTEVGKRVAPQYLERFIFSPSTTHVGSTMPDLLANKPIEQRNKIAKAITHFLLAQSPGKFEHQQISSKDASKGKNLFHSIGCVVCHSPRDEHDKEIIRDGVVKLDHIPAKYSLTSLSDFLFQPTRVRPSGRMPDMKLTPIEARAIASYLIGKADMKSSMIKPKDDLVAIGKRYFEQFNCASCHKLKDISAPMPVGTLTGVNGMRGCLSEKPGKSPHFHLSDKQRKAIRTAISTKPAPGSDKERLAFTLTAFNCIGCHERDNYGGVKEDRNSFFQSSEKELGDEGRIPPPLTLVGAKLQGLTLKKVLFDGDSVRSYMATRMPQFGEQHLRHLPDLFASLDKMKQIEFSLPKSGRKTSKEREREKEMRAAGRELVGDKGLSCIACHSFNGKTASKHGIDLLTFNERLQPSWFYHFVLDPSAFRPRTVMPQSWPGGQALHKSILNGDTKRQIEAIWYYLSLGTSARPPSGIQGNPSLLNVTNETRTYRGRSSVAGYRGIAVGIPKKLNYAFNAETGTLSAIWKGDFIRVNRSGQGSGRFHPAERFIALAQDLSFYKLKDEKTPWPLRPVMTKDAPVNPNPLYPKNLGYQFKGYYFDDASIPTFMYRTGNIQIEDRSFAQGEEKQVLLIRELTFDSPSPQTVWFRALTGKLKSESKQRFSTPKLRLEIPIVSTLLRPTASDSNSSELLLKLTIPKGKSTQKLRYELLP